MELAGFEAMVSALNSAEFRFIVVGDVAVIAMKEPVGRIQDRPVASKVNDTRGGADGGSR